MSNCEMLETLEKELCFEINDLEHRAGHRTSRAYDLIDQIHSLAKEAATERDYISKRLSGQRW